MRITSVLCLLSALYGSAAPGDFGSAAAQGALPAGIKTIEGWTATCNNLGACVAIGTAEADVFFYVRIARDAGAAAAPQVKLVLLTQDPLKGTSPAFALTAKSNGKADPPPVALGPYPAATEADDASQFAATLAPPAASLAFIDATRNADTLDYRLLGSNGTLALKGLSATLRWIDAQQGRAGTPTALVAKGMTPIGQVPEPRNPPVVKAAPDGSVTAIAKPVVPQPVLAKAAALQDCDTDTVQAHAEAEAWRLGDNLILVSTPCINGAYNFSTALYFTDATGGAARPATLPQPPLADDGTSANVVTNMSFDPKTMVLSDFSKGRGIGDCGATRNWIWTGTAFELFEASRLDACAGALPDDWPNVFTAKRG